MKLTMLIPSRLRPNAAWEAAGEALRLAGGDTTIQVCADGEEDPRYYENPPSERLVASGSHERRGLIGTLNLWGERAARVDPQVTHVGFMGDDHRTRTPGWDVKLMEAAGDGLAYGDDLLRGEELPTAVVMHADILRALGRMAPPELYHMYCDDYWLAIGRAGLGIRYVPEVVIEHLHPAAGKAVHDASYDESNSPQRFAADATAWAVFKGQGGVERDVEAVRAWRAAVR